VRSFILKRDPAGWRVDEGSPEGKIFATVLSVDPLGDPHQGRSGVGLATAVGRLIVRSGLGTGVDGPVSWMPASRRGFEAAADELELEAARARVELLLWPDAGHVISDAPSLLTFLRARESRGWRFVLDPVSMLTPTMLPRAEDHVRRAFEALGTHPLAACVVVADVAEEPSRPGSLVLARASETSRLGSLVDARRREVCPALPVVLVE